MKRILFKLLSKLLWHLADDTWQNVQMAHEIWDKSTDTDFYNVYTFVVKCKEK